MSNLRKKNVSAEKELLFAQVEGICPLCGKRLLYKKTNWYKNYEIAHIYPLNPDLLESALLKDEPKLSEDSNSMDNLIPLCHDCHHIFDHPRTIDEYRKLYNKKKQLIDREKIKDLYSHYTILEDISPIIRLLSEQTDNSHDKLEYTALKISEKLKDGFDIILKKHIINDVIDYFSYIKNTLKDIDKNNPGRSDLMAIQIKAFYLATKPESDNQELIYNKMAEWLYTKTEQRSLDACKVIIAFFIQNCEVFEYVSK